MIRVESVNRHPSTVNQISPTPKISSKLPHGSSPPSPLPQSCISVQHFCFWRAAGASGDDDENLCGGEKGYYGRRADGLQRFLPAAAGSLFHAGTYADRL